MFLEVLGDPWDSPEKSKCCYFVGFRWFSEMSCFLMFFHRYLKATLFSLKTKNHIVILLIMEGQNVDISLVLAMVLEIYVFRRCVFNDFLLRFRCKNHVHWWSAWVKNSGNLYAELIILVFIVFFIIV